MTAGLAGHQERRAHAPGERAREDDIAAAAGIRAGTRLRDRAGAVRARAADAVVEGR